MLSFKDNACYTLKLNHETVSCASQLEDVPFGEDLPHIINEDYVI